MATLLPVGSGQTYTTVQSAINASSAGDTISILDATTFTEDLTLSGHSGTSGNVITMQNDSGGTVIVESIGTALTLAGEDYWTIDGIKFRGGAPRVVYNILSTSEYITFNNCVFERYTGDSGYTVHVSYMRNLTITNCIITLTGGTSGIDGVEIMFSNDVLFDGNTITTSSPTTMHLRDDGMVVSGQDITISNNLIEYGDTLAGHPDGIVLQNDGDSYGGPSGNITVNNNIVKDFSQGIYPTGLHGDLIGTINIFNNLVYQDSTPLNYSTNGIVIDGSADLGGMTINVYNNTIVMDQLGIYVLRCGSGTKTIRNNIIYAPQDAVNSSDSTCITNMDLDYNIYRHSGSSTTPLHISTSYYNATTACSSLGWECNGASDATVNFVDESNDDYHLTSNNPLLIDAGQVANTLFTTDKDAVVRGSSWDIGAYEYVGSSPSMNHKSGSFGGSGAFR